MINSIPLATRFIEEQYGDIVEVQSKTLGKYGENPSAGTTEATLMEFQGSETSETYVETNAIDQIVTDDADFDGDVYVEGHYFSGGDKVFHTQTVTANGETAVNLTQSLGRITRMRNASGTSLANSAKIYGFASSGVTVTNGVPQTDSAVKIICSAAENSSLKCATAISGTQYFLITRLTGGMNKKTQGGGILRLKVREDGGVFRTLFKAGVNSLGPNLNENLADIIIVPPNADVIMTGEADSAAGMWGRFSGFLCRITNG